MILLHHLVRRTMLRPAAAALGLLVLGTGIVLSRSALPAAHTVLAGRWPDALLLDADGERAFVANDGDGTVGIFDLAREQLLRTVVVGRGAAFAPLSLALDPYTHRLFVADRMDDSVPSPVQLLDSRSGVLLRIVRAGHTVTALAVDERVGHVFVANGGDASVSMLDARTGAPLRTTSVGIVPVALAVDGRGARAFAIGWPTQPALPGPLSGAGWISMLDTHSGALLRVVAVGHAPSAVATDPTTGRAFVPNRDDNSVSVLDAHSGRVVRTVAVGAAPRALAVDERRGSVFVFNAGDGTVSVLDARTGMVRQTITVDRQARPDLAAAFPGALAVDELRDRVYVSTAGRLSRAGVPTGNGVLHVFDARNGARLRTIMIGVSPQAIAVEERSGLVAVTNGGGVVQRDASWVDQGIQWAARRLPWLGDFAMRPPASYRVPGSVTLIDPGA